MSLFKSLKKYILEDMSMQHIYQPVMLIELLKNQGNASEETIARVILNRDPTQVDYYIAYSQKLMIYLLKLDFQYHS